MPHGPSHANDPSITNLVTPKMPWVEDARCRTQGDPAWFYPDRSASEFSRQAKQVCAHCPVIEQCLRWALENREEHGVWGGLSERERRALMRRHSNRKDAA
jgi:WhiB family redox-sensing transcriptional regulator